MYSASVPIGMPSMNQASRSWDDADDNDDVSSCQNYSNIETCIILFSLPNFNNNKQLHCHTRELSGSVMPVDSV